MASNKSIKFSSTDKEKKLAEYITGCLRDNISFKNRTSAAFPRSVQQRILENPTIRRTTPGDAKKRIDVYGESIAKLTLNQIDRLSTGFEAVCNDLLREILYEPFHVEPTTEPNMSRKNKEVAAKVAIYQLTEKANQLGVPLTTILMGASGKTILTEVKRLALIQLRESAKKTANAVKSYMDDAFEEMNFGVKFKKLLKDITVYPSAILKGVYTTDTMKLGYVTDAAGNPKIMNLRKNILQCDILNPLYFFPSPDSTNCQDGSNIIEVCNIHYTDLFAMSKGGGSYFSSTIDSIIKDLDEVAEHRSVYRQAYYTISKDIHYNVANSLDISQYSKSTDAINPPLSIINYHGKLAGSLLKKFGVSFKSGEPIEDDHVYECEVWVLGDRVIRFVRYDLPEGYQRPYFSVSYKNYNHTFWGDSLVDILIPAQSMIDGAVRLSGKMMPYYVDPPTILDVGSIINGDELTEEAKPIEPGQIIFSQYNGFGTQRAPLSLVAYPNTLPTLREQIEYYTRKMDDISGIQTQLLGVGDSASLHRTASVYQGAADNAMRNIKLVLGEVDDRVLSPFVTYFYNLIMLFGNDETLKGDTQIVTRGSSGLMVKLDMANKFPLISQIIQGQVATGRRDFTALNKIEDMMLTEMGGDTVSNLLTGTLTNEANMEAIQLAAQNAGIGVNTVSQIPNANVPPTGELDGRSPQ